MPTNPALESVHIAMTTNDSSDPILEPDGEEGAQEEDHVAHPGHDHALFFLADGRQDTPDYIVLV